MKITTRMNTITQYSTEVGDSNPSKNIATSPIQLSFVAKYVATVPGSITIENANISGIIPAEFMRNGKYVAPP